LTTKKKALEHYEGWYNIKTVEGMINQENKLQLSSMQMIRIV